MAPRGIARKPHCELDIGVEVAREQLIQAHHFQECVRVSGAQGIPGHRHRRQTAYQGFQRGIASRPTDAVEVDIAHACNRLEARAIHARQHDEVTRRIARVFEQAGLDPARHLVMLPRMDGASFQAVARVSDIYLDSIGWSGCNTTLEALVGGLPAVTMAGNSLRARHTYAFLKMMGLDELLASDFDSYVELAVRLARDAPWRHALRERMLERLPRLAGDMACVRALETFLERAVNQRAQRA